MHYFIVTPPGTIHGILDICNEEQIEDPLGKTAALHELFTGVCPLTLLALGKYGYLKNRRTALS